MTSHSGLDRLLVGRPVQLLLPFLEGGTLHLSGTVSGVIPPRVEVRLLPGERPAREFDPNERCMIYQAAGEQSVSLVTRFEELSSDGVLHLRVHGAPGTWDGTSREYFRIDTELQLRFWSLPVTRQPLGRGSQQKVNLSGGGIRFRVEEPFYEGQRIGLELALPGSPPATVKCEAEVVRMSPLRGGYFDVATQFMGISRRDRDRIIAYCFAQQRRDLRRKVQVLG